MKRIVACLLVAVALLACPSASDAQLMLPTIVKMTNTTTDTVRMGATPFGLHAGLGNWVAIPSGRTVTLTVPAGGTLHLWLSSQRHAVFNTQPLGGRVSWSVTRGTMTLNGKPMPAPVVLDVDTHRPIGGVVATEIHQ